VVDLRPFLWAAAAWAALSVGVLFAVSVDRGGALQSWALYYILALADLFFLVKTVAALLLLMSDQCANTRTAPAIQAFFYGGLKRGCLGAIGLCLWKIPSTTSGGILFGLGSIVAIPLFGGFLWSQQVLKESEGEANSKH